MEMIIGQGQNIRFGVVGDSHHNGVSENLINAVAYMAHTMMI